MLRQFVASPMMTMTMTQAAVMKKKAKKRRKVKKKSPPGETPSVEDSSASNYRESKLTFKLRKKPNLPELFSKVLRTSKLSKINRNASGTSIANCRPWQTSLYPITRRKNKKKKELLKKIGTSKR